MGYSDRTLPELGEENVRITAIQIIFELHEKFIASHYQIRWMEKFKGSCETVSDPLTSRVTQPL